MQDASGPSRSSWSACRQLNLFRLNSMTLPTHTFAGSDDDDDANLGDLPNKSGEKCCAKRKEAMTANAWNKASSFQFT